VGSRTRRSVSLAASFVAFLVVAAALAGCSSGKSSSSASASKKGPNDWSAIPSVAQKVGPSIVTIQTPSSLGSGVVFTADGVIATVAHVVGSEKAVKVLFADGKHADGEVIGTDPATDLAAVKASRSGLPPAKFDQSRPALGDLAIAIGSPLGFTSSVTSGVISGLGRSIPGTAPQTTALVDLLQTDAAISPGNSGGGVVDGMGAVIGLAEAYVPPSEGAVSIGFAIPSYAVVDVMNQLLQKGSVSHPYLGVSAVPITPDLQQQLGLQQSSGALVQEVAGGGPAEKAGLEPGDVIVSVDGKPIHTPEDLIAAVRSHKPGDTVQVSFARDGTEHTVGVTLVEQP
jgi:S1-C subfamily serine protease